MVLNQHEYSCSSPQRERGGRKKKALNITGWFAGWSGLDLVSAGSVCKRQTCQSLSRQEAPRPVCSRAVICDSTIYKGMGGLEA